MSCKLSQIREVTQVLANATPHCCETSEMKSATADILKKIETKLKGEFPLLDPIEHMKIELPRVYEIIE